MDRRKRKLTKAQVEELLDLSERAPKRMLTPAQVVARAKHESSALHDYFTWDNNKAAEQWRLNEARELITLVKLEVTVNRKTQEVRTFVSLASDRTNGGGYRRFEDVMSDEDLKKEMLRTALAELEVLRTRYERLTELAAVWRAVAKVKINKNPRPKN